MLHGKKYFIQLILLNSMKAKLVLIFKNTSPRRKRCCIWFSYFNNCYYLVEFISNISKFLIW